MDSIDFTRTEEYIDELKKKDFFSFRDYDYGGEISERVYVTQDVKGIYSGVTETKNEFASRSVITFFEFNYVEGKFFLYNGKGKPLQGTTQNLNRVFRRIDAIENVDSENFVYLKNLARAYSWDVTAGILESLEVGGELSYNMSLELAGDDSMTDKLKTIAHILDVQEKKVSYKNILKYMGLTKADLSNEDYKQVKFGLIRTYHISHEFPSLLEAQQVTDFSKGEVTRLPAWYSTPRARLEVLRYMMALSSEYGYTESVNQLWQHIEHAWDRMYYAMSRLWGSGRYVNLEKMVKYLFIDVYYHQGITTFDNAVSLYNDYLALVSDLDNFLMYPKYLRVAHDIAAKAKSQLKVGDTGVYDTSSKLSAIEGVYTVKSNGEKKKYPLEVLLSGSEIRGEATNQSNCLAGYISTVAQGHSIIMSLKNPDNYADDKSLKSWISVEVRRESSDTGSLWYLAQAYKTYNSSLSKDDMSILSAILVKNGIVTTHRVTGYGPVSQTLESEVISKSELEGSHESIKEDIARYKQEQEQAKETLSHNTDYIGRL